VANPNVVPFGVGRRRCLGEGVARVEIYLFICALVQNFHIEVSSSLISLELIPFININSLTC